MLARKPSSSPSILPLASAGGTAKSAKKVFTPSKWPSLLLEGTAVYRVVDIIEEPEIHLVNLFPQLHRIQLRRAFFVPWAEVDLEISGQPVVIVVDYLSRRCVDQRRNGRSSW